MRDREWHGIIVNVEFAMCDYGKIRWVAGQLHLKTKLSLKKMQIFNFKKFVLNHTPIATPYYLPVFCPQGTIHLVKNTC